MLEFFFSDLNFPVDPPLSNVETIIDKLYSTSSLKEFTKGFNIFDNPEPPPKNKKDFLFRGFIYIMIYPFHIDPLQDQI